ncbi:MAG: glycosyltransferase family 2 protein [Actinomycetota bacterium]|nr:glycosyltransferase family 2 protein [Actinomycetota bacterium]
MTQLSSTTSERSTGTTRHRDPAVLAILVARNGMPWLRDCLRALSRQTFPRLGVVAVDIGSADGSRELLERALGPDRVLSMPETLGLPAAVQAALRVDAAGRADYVLILHDDTVLEPDALARLVEAAERVEGVGVVGPKVVDLEDPRILRDVGRSTDRFADPYSPLEEGEIDHGQYDRVREVMFVSSCAMLVSRAAWHRAGVPDERLSPAHEDLDFCWRARLAGFRVLMAPAARARHHDSVDDGTRYGRDADRPLYHEERTTLASMLKNYGLFSLLWILPLYVIQSVVKSVAWAVSRRFGDVYQLLAAWVWNLVHLPSTVRRRIRAQSVRSVPDRAIRRYMAPVTVRLRHWAESAGGRFRGAQEVGAGDRPLDEQEELELPSLGTRTVSVVRAHPAATAWVLFAAVAALAYRQLVGPGSLEGGVIPMFPAHPSDFFRELDSGFRTTGLGGAQAASPALAMLGGISAVLFASTELAAKALLILLPPLAGLTFYRATVRQTGQRLPAVVGASCYGLSSVLMWAFSQGRIGTLVLMAVLPPLAARLRAAFGPGAPSRTTRFVVETGMILAVGVAFSPGTPLAFALVALAFLVFPVPGGRRVRGLGLTVATVLVGGALVFPFAITLAQGQGVGLSSLVGRPEFASLARLAPDGGPGSWAVAWFLPAAALLGFTMVDRTGRRAAVRYLVIGVAAVYLAWLAAAGYLPHAVSNPGAYLVAAALSYCTLVALGVAAAMGMERRAFGYRQLAVVVLAALLAAGLGLQAAEAVRGGWDVGRSQLPPAWPLVAGAQPGSDFRVLWVGRRSGDPFPAPGGDPQGTVSAGGTTVSYAITGRNGVTALDMGRPEQGDAYAYVDRVLAEMLSGSTEHGGALLGPLGVRFVVADEAGLPPRAKRRLNAQVDLDLLPAGGLVIYRNERAIPPAATTLQPEYAQASRGSDLLEIETLPPFDGGSLREIPGGFEGIVPGATRGSQRPLVLLADQFSPGWQLLGVGASIDCAGLCRVPVTSSFGWATAFHTGGVNSFRITFADQWKRTAEMVGLGVLWVLGLWITRKPSRGPR